MAMMQANSDLYSMPEPQHQPNQIISMNKLDKKISYVKDNEVVVEPISLDQLQGKKPSSATQNVHFSQMQTPTSQVPARQQTSPAKHQSQFVQDDF
jgi:hypothetical protein